MKVTLPDVTLIDDSQFSKMCLDTAETINDAVWLRTQLTAKVPTTSMSFIWSTRSTIYLTTLAASQSQTLWFQIDHQDIDAADADRFLARLTRVASTRGNANSSW